MLEKRVKVSSIVQNQLPEFVRSEFPLVQEFLQQYYRSLESSGNPYDLMNNIDQYVKVDNISDLIRTTSTTQEVDFFDSTIFVESTSGFPEKFGIIEINGEIIVYESKTQTSFENCYRGFSGVTSYNSNTLSDELTFSSSFTTDHVINSEVLNLNSLLLSEFFNKIKKQITPGFENREFYSDLNERLFVKESNSFYRSKGTKESFRILFGALYGKPVEVILPKDFLFEASNAQYRITKDIVVEEIEGNALNLLNKTLYQNSSSTKLEARGTVTGVEKITRFNNPIIKSINLQIDSKSSNAIIKDYYIVSLDYDYDKDIEVRGSTFGEFKIHPKTRLVSNTVSGQTFLDVDSTIEFADSGNLLIDLENGSSIIISYTSKSLTQFFGCSGIDRIINAGEEVKSDDYAYALDNDGSEIKVRVTGVISNINIDGAHNLLSPGNSIKIKSLGKSDLDDIKLNNWFFNIATNYKVKELNLIVPGEYSIITYDENDFKIGDKVYLIPDLGSPSNEGEVLFSNKNEVVITGQGNLVTDGSIVYSIHRKITKLSISEYPELSIYNSNVSNTYYDKVNNCIYVDSSSLPNYGSENIKINDYSKIINSFGVDLDINNVAVTSKILFSTPHTFLTGDNVIVKINNDEEQVIGFVKKINNTEIKVAKNKDSILSNNFIDFSEYSISGVSKVEYFKNNEIDLDSNKFKTKQLQTQKLLRKISSPQAKGSKDYQTESGPIGIFLNGVELENYKSEDYIYYGSIESIDVLSGGFGYDVINPPEVLIKDSVGSGASAFCSVVGSLERIDIAYPGFDYLEIPKIEITGGNGIGAEAEASLISYDHIVKIDVNAGSVDNNQISFNNPHNFTNYEEVVYEPLNSSIISGLSTNSTYFVKVVGINTIKLFSSFNNAVSDNNLTLSVSGNLGVQQFRSVNKKRKIGKIKIINPGSGYTNKKQVAYQTGINTSNSTIFIKNHGFKYGEIITYYPETTSIGGLTTSNYYVNPIDTDYFRLFEISNNFNNDFLLKTNQYVNLTSKGGEKHYFNYPEIKVNILGTFNVPTLRTDLENIQANIQPIFRGQVNSLFVDNKGINYGSDQVLNYSKQPQIILNSGSGAEVKVVVVGGRIEVAYVVSSGDGYTSIPELVVNGEGTGAVLTPIIQSGKLVDVIISSSGGGYSPNNTFIDVISSGEEAKLYANIKSWNICLPERFPSLLSNLPIENLDDGYLVPSKYGFGLQYTHLYPSRQIRRIVNDLVYENGFEEDSIEHSPIIGWAYDGNPIYGPYGHSNPDATGGIKLMKSGYEKVITNINRPSNYKEGFFVEDYVFTDVGDLDEHNGRFCITPEFPNGIYAYFSTFINQRKQGYKIPEFPYVIGNSYKSKPIEFNFDINSNHDIIDINQTGWFRNTYPYNQSKLNSGYDYFLNSSDLVIDSKIRTVFGGKIEEIKILNPGEDYKINDLIVFDNESTGGKDASARIESLVGVAVTNIKVSKSIELKSVELLKLTGNTYVGYSTIPHNISNLTYLNVYSNNETPQYRQVTVPINNYVLSSGIGSISETGISTYISVSGNLQLAKENDIYTIGEEKIKIINVDFNSSRLRILRSQEGTVGVSSYESGTIVIENPRRFELSYSTNNSYSNKINKQIYFNPSESIGIGTSFGVGITSTLYFSNPGVGETSIKIPTRSIYLPNHGLNTGEILIYNTNEGSPISISTNGVNSSFLNNNTEVFATKISNDLIGISTVKVGLNSEGSFSGIGTIPGDLLYFVGVGTNTYHSFKTSYQDILNVEVSKNLITVSTAETHGMSLLDTVFVDVKSNNENNIKIRYNELNRRLVTDRLQISSVNIANDSLLISNNKLKYGEKIIFEEVSQILGLVDNLIYYVYPINSNEFRLSTSNYNLNNNIFVEISSSGSGYITKINPEITITKYQPINFDLSDESLSYLTGAFGRQPSFKFKFFYDSNYSDEIYPSNSNDSYKLTQTGIVGSTLDAKVSLVLNENSPKRLYYKLVPIDNDSNPEIKKEIIIDNEQLNYLQINLVESEYNGSHNVIGITSNTFSYELEKYPEIVEYNSTNSTISYTTNSNSAKGPINNIKINSGGNNYKSLPTVSILSDTGKNGNIQANSSNIGIINKVDLDSIGYNYSVDTTIRPLVNIPSIMRVNPLSIFDDIKVVEKGFAYTNDSDLVVIDGLTNKLINDTELVYSITDSKVNIIKNTKGINNVSPIIIPVNNSNGIGINSITYDEITQDVTIFLNSTFSDPDDFPFEVGSLIFIEGVNIRPGEPGVITKNYNSSSFNYALFELTEVNSNLGFYGATIKYNVSSYLKNNETLGIFDSNESDARVIPQIYFPVFEVSFKKSNFIVGETIRSNNATGLVEDWDFNTGTLVISTSDSFNVNSSIFGETSEFIANIISIISSEGSYDIQSNSIVNKFWNLETGFLNNDLQRLHDNDYYQYFSYALKSEVPLQIWEDSVSSLNHTAGFKKFSIVKIENTSLDSRIDQNQNQGDIGAVYSADSVIDLDCVTNFDLARENILRFENNLSSNRIFLNSKKIQDYILSIGNKVLLLDDISDQFSNEIRPEIYSVVDTTNVNTHRFLKYFIRTFDRRFGEESMFNIVSILQDGTYSYLNQYGKLISKEDLGFFDFEISGDEGRLLFFPNKFDNNNYTICYNLFSLDGDFSGYSNLSLGGSVEIQTHSVLVPEGTSTSVPIVSISSTFRSIKLQTLITNEVDNEYESIEINLVHDDSNVYLTDYGMLETNENLLYNGLGQFDASISGSNIIVSFTPNVSIASSYNINSLSVSIGNSTTIGTGKTTLTNTYIESGITTISSSPSPSAVSISSYSASDYSSAYYAVSIEDLTNNEYQFSEILVNYNQDLDDVSQVEYGVVETGSNLGIITSGTQGSGLSKKVHLYFTPKENISYEVRVYKSIIGGPTVFDFIELPPATIEEGIGFYEGRLSNLKTSFNLTHNGNTVFEKVFDGSNSNIIDLNNDTILIPNHYFVTGEKISYNLGGRFGSPIGIASTTISGIGVTDKLPSTLYAIKVDDLTIRVSASSTQALKTIPEYLDLDSVGTSVNHTFLSEKQNSKSLISLDNIIQSPVVSTSTTTFLLEDFTKLSNIITVDNPLQISGGDYLQIDDEIVRTVIVGYAGSFNDILVDREYLGTIIDNHSSGAFVKKIEANYNIVGNTIHFADSPRGRVPQENPLNPEEVDFEGLKIKSSFSGRVFLRSGIPDTDITPYEKNYVFDTISNKFDGTTESFSLTSEFENISGISSNNFITLVRNIFQLPERISPRSIEGDYSLTENSEITSIIFKPNSNTVNYDINVKNIPRGGIIVSVGSTEGFGYQPLVSAGGTAIVSAAGTISSISIGNNGSGYRSGIQTTVNVGVKTLTDHVENIGIASISNGSIVSIAITNPGFGYTSYYEVISTLTSQSISLGSTTVYIDSTNNINPTNLITIPGYLDRVKIVSVASTFINIGVADTITSSIPSELDVLVEQFSPPFVVFDDPLSYTNIPLIYSSSTSQVGLGTEATVDLVVSQDSSVLNFEIKNYGYGYNNGDILTVDIGGLTGIPTNTTLPFSEFQLTVDGIYDDQFASWHLGKLIVIDPIDDLIDGRRRFFPIRIDGEQISFESREGSNLNLSANLLILVNDVLQTPGESYIFDGGSVIEFIEPPLSFDDATTSTTKTKILFYEGTGGIDTKDIDILETVKVGDSFRLDSDNINLKENKRTIQEIISSDSVRTNLYSDSGISNDEKLLRNVIWCKQRNDKFLSNVGFGKSTNSYIISKARESYEPYINPSAYLIKDVNIVDSEIFVDNLETFFNSFDEIGTGDNEIYKVIKISSQDNVVSCAATAVVSIAGTISSIVISNSGIGYENTPSVYISSPINSGTKSILSASLSGSSVSNISVVNGGSGYSQLNPPSVLVEPPRTISETLEDAFYEGDFGIVTGINTVSVGVASTGIAFDLFIPENSYIRDSEITGSGSTSISGIQTGYYFVLRHTNIGNGLTSLDENGLVIGIGSTFIDNVYRAANVSIAQTSVVGVGTTYVAQVTVSVSDYNGIVSLGQTYYYGSYSWGRISNLIRKSPKEHNTYKNGISGISSSPIIQRYRPLKNDLYTS